MSQITIRGVLSLPILIPLLIGLIQFKKADLVGRLFVFFLLLGFCTDSYMWFLLSTNRFENLLVIFNTYSLMECLFLFYFLHHVAISPTLKTATKTFLYLSLPFWIICIFIYPLVFDDQASRSAPFDSTYEIIASFLAGFVLLERVEKEVDIFLSSVFWFTIGVFFYCFCTFFIMGFLETKIVQKIWFINNIINITSYLFYAIGFWQIRSHRNIAS